MFIIVFIVSQIKAKIKTMVVKLKAILNFFLLTKSKMNFIKRNAE